MKRFVSALLAASSLAFGFISAAAATRPHYGGTLRVAIAEAPQSLDPADPVLNSSTAGRNLARLIFDRLVILDERGLPRPALATSWQAETGDQRWELQLRRDAAFHDGTPLSAGVAAASLRAANPAWRIEAHGDAVLVEFDSPHPNFLAELALSRNGIAKRAGGKLVGTGAFAIREWEPGRKLLLAANNEYWAGRPFLDAIAAEMGRSYRDQMIALDLGQADLIEIPAERARRAAAENRRVQNSAPVELMALVFGRALEMRDDQRLCQAIGLSMDRASLNAALLEGQGEPTGALLPNWITGYAFLFSQETNVAQARQIRSEVKSSAAWTLAYDPNDPLARVVAERVALNARDAGIALQLTTSGAADLRLVRASVASVEGRTALTALAWAIGLPLPRFPGSAEESLYNGENVLLQTRRAIPLIYLPVSYGVSPAVRNWSATADGSWRLQDTWLTPNAAAGKP